MSKEPQDWIVYWKGDIPTATWVTRKEARALIRDNTVKVTNWLRADKPKKENNNAG